MAGRHVPAAHRGVRTFDNTSERAPWRVPNPPRGHRWHKDSLEAWRAVTSSGITDMWVASDSILVKRWHRLVDLLAHTMEDPSASLSAIKQMSGEIRLLEQSLGISPQARAVLRISPSDSSRRAPKSALSDADLAAAWRDVEAQGSRGA